MSFTITLSGRGGTLHTNFNPPIYLDPEANYVIGLTNFETFNAIPNIDEKNNKIYLGNNELIEIPPGSYELKDINRYLQEKFQEKKIVFQLSANNNTLKSEIVSSVDIHFKEGTIGKILGFKNQTIKGDSIVKISDYPAEIIKVNYLCVDCAVLLRAPT